MTQKTSTDHVTKPTKPKPRKSSASAGRAKSAKQANSDKTATGMIKKPSFVVGVGASAGGLEALEEFFRAIPEDNDIAFVVIQHLSPDFKSMMDELLARHTKMKIHRAKTGVSLEPGSIYLMIPRQNLIVENGKLKLVKPDLSRGLNLPVDIMFDSLAKDRKDTAIAIILSGAGRDGSRGIEKIKEYGGYVMSQDETTAKFDSMPRSAFATGLTDYVGSPHELGQHVLRRAMHPSATPLNDKPMFAANSTKLEEVIGILRTGTEFDFTYYKSATLIRRIERRMGVLQISSLDSYIDHLTQHDVERQDLARDMLIGVTRFFRDPEMWNELKIGVLKPMLAAKKPDEEFRAWVSACSSGEEAYSLAITLKEIMEELGIHRIVKIFASDIDPVALEAAGTGIFPQRIATEMSSELLKKYFQRREDSYVVSRPIREMIIFARHNLITDAPFTRLDFASCRNMLIYLEISAQKQALANLHFSLKDDGQIFIGPSESLGELVDAFQTDIDSIKCFRKHPDGRSKLSRSNLIPSIGARLRQPSTRARQIEVSPKSDAAVYNALEHIAGTLSHPGMLVSSDGHLIYSFGNLQTVATLPSGGFSSDVVRLVHKEIGTALSAALRRCVSSMETVVYQDISFNPRATEERVTIRIDPIKNEQTDEPTFLILFEESRKLELGETDATKLVSDPSANEDIQQLENELRATKETLQSTIEELETSNEELQSSNEELIASNEELQSTNEELHSVNEELQTVNTEYQAKISELTIVTEDFENLLRSTNIGTIFLDDELKIRKFTHSVTDVIDLVDHDIGRRIDQFRTKLNNFKFVDNVKRVLKTGKTFIQEVQVNEGAGYMMRIMPFQSVSRRDSGVVITFVDITSLERASAALAVAEKQFSGLLEGYPMPVCLIDKKGGLRGANTAWSDTFGYVDSENVGLHINALFKTKEVSKSNQKIPNLWMKLQNEDNLEATQIFGVTKEGDDFPANITLQRLGIGDVDVIIVENLSEKHASTLALKEAIGDLKRSNVDLEQFGTVVAHDLKEPLRMVRGYTKLLTDDFKDGLGNEGQEYLDNIEAGTTRMQDMIDDLLSFATVTSDETESIEVDFEKVVTEIKRTLQTKIEQTGTKLSVKPLPTLKAKPRQVLHIFQNLIENAIKYRSDDPPNISIEAVEFDDVWRFSVQDNGIGIKSQHSEKIFDVFKRLHGRGKYAGTGIGLAIVKKIVHNHGGSVWVESEPGVGSTFYFTISLSDG